MLYLLAHSQQFHTKQTSGLQHFLTTPVVMNVLFLAGILILSWIFKRVLQLTLWQRIGVISGYCLLSSFLSFSYDKPLAILAFSLSVLGGLGVVYFWLLLAPTIDKKK